MRNYTQDQLTRTSNLTMQVVECLREYVTTIPMGVWDSDAVALLKSYLRMGEGQQVDVANVKRLREQTYEAMYACRQAWTKHLFGGEIPKVYNPIGVKAKHEAKVKTRREIRSWGTYSGSKVDWDKQESIPLTNSSAGGRHKKANGTKNRSNKGGK